MSDSGGERILVVEDDERVSGLLARHLARAGFGVTVAESGGEVRREFANGRIDLVLLDLDLADADGLDLLAEIRQTGNVPAILMSERNSEGDRILGLRLGADDYVVKPFSPAELVARVAAVLRRCGRVEVPPLIVHGDLEIDARSRQVFVEGRDVGLARLEFELLATLAAQPRRAFARAELLREVWGVAPGQVGGATVTEHVRRLRRKLGDRPEGPSRIVTVPGVGYRFEP